MALFVACVALVALLAHCLVPRTPVAFSAAPAAPAVLAAIDVVGAGLTLRQELPLDDVVGHRGRPRATRKLSAAVEWLWGRVVLAGREVVGSHQRKAHQPAL